jgi:hypothetical protein
MTFAEYPALESASERKYAYVNGCLYAMAGGTPAHARLQGRRIQQRARPCADDRARRSPATSAPGSRPPAARPIGGVTILCERIGHAAEAAAPR